MAEKIGKEDQVPSPARTSSGSLGVVIPGTRETIENTTSTTSGSVSPKLPIARIFSRTRSSSSQQSQSKEDSDETSQSLSETEREKKRDRDKSSWQFFGTPKPKSHSGWINLPFSFTMSHREKNEEIHKIFGQLPASERLVDDYSCALQRDILVHGRLYITQNWLCFYANIFAWETLLTIPFQTVISITKERTALLIPNAMQISTTVEKYGFSSFMQRDISYNIIFKVWQNSLLDQPLSPRELVKAAKKAWGDSTDVGTEEELWGQSGTDSKPSSPKTRRQQSMPTHVEIGQLQSTLTSKGPPPQGARHSVPSSHEGRRINNRPPPLSPVTKSYSAVEHCSTDNNPVPTDDATPRERRSQRQDAVGEEISTGSNNGGKLNEQQRNNVGTVTEQGRPQPGKDTGLGDSGGDSSAEFETYDFPDQGEIPCGCSEHTGRTILNDIYHGEVETVFQLLFTDSDFYRSFLKSRKTTNIEISEWSTQGDSTRLRDISYTLALNYSFGPKFSTCNEHQVYFKNGQPGVKHIVQTDAINGNVPYGDAFYVSCRFCMTRVAHNRTRLRVTSNICFKKNCWGVVKNLIERNAGDGLRSYYGHLDSSLKEYLASLPAKGLQKNKRPSRRRHRRQSSVPKEEDGSSSLRKRRGSVSSRLSLKSFDNKGSEEGQEDKNSKENKRFSSLKNLPKVNLALTLLLGVLVIFNMILYHQLMSYKTPLLSSTSPPQFSSVSSSQESVSSDKIEWPNSPEEWKNLFKEYWQHENEDKKQLTFVLQGVVDTLKQVENAIGTTRTHLQAQKDNIYHNSIETSPDNNNNK